MQHDDLGERPSPTPDRARALWEELALAPGAFTTSAASPLTVVVSPGSRLCPPGWVGIVRLGAQAIATAADEASAALVRTALGGLGIDEIVQPEAVAAVLPIARSLGPASLAYLAYRAPDDLRPPVLATASGSGQRVELLPGGHPDLAALTESVGQEDADEAAVDSFTSPTFVVRDVAGGKVVRGEVARGKVVAAAGYVLWPARTAHLGVLTAPSHRGQGLARLTAGAATRHALEHGLLPQWRARVPASKRVARALGFTELGTQFSLLLREREGA